MTLVTWKIKNKISQFCVNNLLNPKRKSMDKFKAIATDIEIIETYITIV
jgi:hypothetical protein